MTGDIKALAENMKRSTPGSYNDFPDIDLYMDQVISYLSRQQTAFCENEKLTSAMVNNYIKEGLLPRANGKRYSREHLAYLSIISRLKQVLSVKETDLLLKQEMQGTRIDRYYEEFAALLKSALGELVEDMERCPESALSSTAMKLAVNAYVNKIACEFLLSRLASNGKEK